MATLNTDTCAVLCAGQIADYGWLTTQASACNALICADAGLEHAKRCGLAPDAVVGDFDSCEKPKDGNVLAFPVRKDETDAYLAVSHAVKLGYKRILLLGATGGRLDHTYANLVLCADFARRGIHVEIADELNRVLVAAPGRHRVSADGYKKLSLFAFGEDVTALTTGGVSYPLTRYNLSTVDSLAVCNEITGAYASIEFESGLLLIIRSNDAKETLIKSTCAE